MTKKYLLMPGYVYSENDGDKHYISPLQLKNLYNVPMSECLIYNERTFKNIPKDLIVLKPSHSGNYTIPKEKQ
jgi:hypothetical protein